MLDRAPCSGNWHNSNVPNISDSLSVIHRDISPLAYFLFVFCSISAFALINVKGGLFTVQFEKGLLGSGLAAAHEHNKNRLDKKKDKAAKDKGEVYSFPRRVAHLR